jgi:hypothetical protein
MQVSYGPPGHKGVTHLMAVGADDDASSAEPVVQNAMVLSAAAAGLGLLLGSKTLRTAGLAGVLVALGIGRALKRPRIVELTRPL